VNRVTSIFDTVAKLEQEEDDDDEDEENDDDDIQLHRRRRQTGRSDDHKDDEHGDDRLSHHHQQQQQQQQRQKLAVLAQTNIYSRLMECRILLQRSITSLDAVVAVEDGKTAKNNDHSLEGGMEISSVPVGISSGTADAAIDQCNQILAHLLEARKLLSYDNSTAQKSNNDGTKVDYASLLKETSCLEQRRCDVDDNDNDGDESASITKVTLEAQLQKEYEMWRTQWKEVLNRRHYELQLHSGMVTNHKKFNIVDTSFWSQVQSTIQHQQLRNNSHTIATLSLQSKQNSLQYQPFNDTKLYQQMLKDFVETAMTSQQTNQHNSNPLTNTAAWMRKHRATSSKSTSSHKAMVDRKASKGRKIRYTTITKLTNFTFPIQRRHRTTATTLNNNDHLHNDDSWTMNSTFLDEDAWFRSLFGGQ
jgi:protein AATF/BFR2